MLIQIIIFTVSMITLYLLVIMPKLRKNRNISEFDGWMYAHRGLHNNQSEAPENSIRAFQLAIDHHYGIELDVQLTKDLIPIILHDFNLLRTCGKDQKVSDLTYKELQQFQLFESKEKIPTLQEALACINGKVPLIIELKIPWKADKTCEAVSRIMVDYPGVYCIESFNPFGLIWYRMNRPLVVRGQLSTDFAKDRIKGSRTQYFILEHLLFNFLTKPDFIAYHHIYKKRLVIVICRKLFRIKVFAWTIQSQKDLEESETYFDLFIFDSFIPKHYDHE